METGGWDKGEAGYLPFSHTVSENITVGVSSMEMYQLQFWLAKNSVISEF